MDYEINRYCASREFKTMQPELNVKLKSMITFLTPLRKLKVVSKKVLSSPHTIMNIEKFVKAPKATKIRPPENYYALKSGQQLLALNVEVHIFASRPTSYFWGPFSFSSKI